MSMEGIEKHIDEQIRPVVAAKGFAVQHIDNGDVRTNFCYTIGMIDRGYPELLLKGFHPVIAFALLRYLGEHMLETCAPGVVVDRTRLRLPIGPESAEVGFWLLAPTPEQDRDEGPGLAKAYYQQWVPHLRVKAAGWPCDRCTALYDERTRCTCKFACGWHACTLQDGRTPIEEVAPGQYRIGAPVEVPSGAGECPQGPEGPTDV